MKHAAAPGRALESPSLPAVLTASGAAAHLVGVDAELLASLPRDHPAWQRDVLAVSSRVRAVLADLRPVVVRVLSFWDHLVRGIAVGERYIEVDPHLFRGETRGLSTRLSATTQSNVSAGAGTVPTFILEDGEAP